MKQRLKKLVHDCHLLCPSKFIICGVWSFEATEMSWQSARGSYEPLVNFPEIKY
jgi:hypothetical protein